MLPSNLVNNLEILPIVVYHLGCKFCITTFYRPPNSPSSIFDTLFSFLMSLNVPTFLNFVLLGDIWLINLCITKFVVYWTILGFPRL